MFKERTPAWIITGGFLLTFGAGCINAVGFLGYHHQPISHLTGTVTQFGNDLALANLPLAAHAGAVILSFFLGCFVTGFIVRQTSLRVGRRYGAVLSIESVVLYAAYRLLRGNIPQGDYLLAVACGLQNAMATSYSGSVIRSTHMTGIITDLGIALGHAVRHQVVDWLKFRLYLWLLTGFLAGSMAGTLGWTRFGYDVLLFPATVFGVSGLSYTIYKHWQRTAHVPSRQV